MPVCAYSGKRAIIWKRRDGRKHSFRAALLFYRCGKPSWIGPAETAAFRASCRAITNRNHISVYFDIFRQSVILEIPSSFAARV